MGGIVGLIAGFFAPLLIANAHVARHGDPTVAGGYFPFVVLSTPLGFFAGAFWGVTLAGRNAVGYVVGLLTGVGGFVAPLVALRWSDIQFSIVVIVGALVAMMACLALGPFFLMEIVDDIGFNTRSASADAD